MTVCGLRASVSQPGYLLPLMAVSGLRGIIYLDADEAGHLLLSMAVCGLRADNRQCSDFLRESLGIVRVNVYLCRVVTNIKRIWKQ